MPCLLFVKTIIQKKKLKQQTTSVKKFLLGDAHGPARFVFRAVMHADLLVILTTQSIRTICVPRSVPKPLTVAPIRAVDFAGRSVKQFVV